jgi:dihydroorotate dehydrogenase electron transfer subunit
LNAPAARWMQVEGRVLGQKDEGAEHRWLEVATPSGFATPEPGEFVQLLLEHAAGDVLLARPMSVAGVRRDGEGLVLEFLYAPVGVGTRALSRLRAGEGVVVLGPLGQGFPLEEPGTPVLVAGGRGVAPLLFAAAALARARRPCTFLFGARDRARLVGLEQARRELARMEGTLHLCTDDGSEGFEGNVVELLDSLVSRLEPPLVLHACGPHAMLGALARWALRRGCRAHLAMESVMACGTGVCRGCPLPRSDASRAAFDPATTPSLFGNRDFAMCCTDGPVFESRELDWERIE